MLLTKPFLLFPMSHSTPPFDFGSVVRDDLFTDRLRETEHLVNNFRIGINTILISPRRMGKTSLITKARLMAASPQLRIAAFDAFSCCSEQDFLTAYAQAVIKATSSKTADWLRNARRFLSALAPEVSIGLDPQSQFSLRFGLKDLPQRAEDILNLPEAIALKENFRIVVCIDEFQQISLFANSDSFLKKLRSVWQHHAQACYCLYGSQKHMMNAIFQTPSAPFYRFGDLFYLEKIPRSDWATFIVSRFQATGKHISEELAGRIADTADCYSNYVQQLALYVWECTDDNVTEAELQQGVDRLLASCEPLFIEQTARLARKQMNFLHALADGLDHGFSEKPVLERYDLTSSAHVTRARDALLEKDMITIPARGVARIADPILKLWLQRRVWPATA